MSVTWPTVKLGDLADFRNGVNYTQNARRRGGLPIIGVKDFQARLTVDFDGLEELDPEEVDARGSTVREGDILFVRSNGNRELIGRSMLIAATPPRPTTHSGFTIRLRFRDENAYPRFFGYLLRGPLVRRTLSSQGGGTNINNLNQGILASLQVPLPPNAVQERIASILGAYDDLIGVNRRRIALLEDMARRLFEEWFVGFRFPGHKAHPMGETAEGQLPEGWKSRQVGQFTSYLSRGLTPTYDDTATTLVINQKCIRAQRLSLSTARRQSKAVPDDKLVQLGDVLVNSTGVGTLGRVAQVELVLEGLTVDTHVTIVRPVSHVDRDFFGLALLSMEPMFERLGAGATGQTELNRARIADVPLVEPPSDVQADFGRLVRPMRELAFRLTQQNETLAHSRDLLLPRLISGELSVAVAEHEFEAAA